MGVANWSRGNGKWRRDGQGEGYRETVSGREEWCGRLCGCRGTRCVREGVVERSTNMWSWDCEDVAEYLEVTVSFVICLTQ